MTKYVVTNKADNTKRLIEAGAPANAIAHCAKDSFTAERVSDDIASLIGLSVEKVTPDKAAGA